MRIFKDGINENKLKNIYRVFQTTRPGFLWGLFTKKSKNKKTRVKYFLKLYPTTLKPPPPPCPMLGVEGSTSEIQMETPIFFCRFGFVNKKKQHFV